MHFTETSRVTTTTTSAASSPEAKSDAATLRINKSSSRPWDYDTEDSGVDSVSSLAGLEADSSGVANVEYSSVIVNTNQVHNVERQPQQRKSFLHNVYGTPSSILDCNANKNLSLRKRSDKIMNQQDSNRLVETAKNHFLHSLLDDETKTNEPAAAVSNPASDPSSTSSVALDFLPELVQLLEVNRVMDGGLIELIGRDGTRASLRLTLAPSSQSSTVSPAAVTRKNSFNGRLHRNSKRSSQRRAKMSQSEATTNIATAPNIINPAKKATSQDSHSSSSSSGLGFMGQPRPRSVRRRPSSSSSSHKKLSNFSVSMAIPPSKVAVLASKFNSLISESRRGTSNQSIRDKNLSSCNVYPVSASSLSLRLSPAAGEVTTASSLNHSTKRIMATSSVKPSVDTIPEIADPVPEEIAADYSKPRRKSYDLSQPSGRSHSAARPLPSDPASSRQPSQSQHSVYGTVKSIVKHAIKKFEKLDNGVHGATESSTADAGTSSLTNRMEHLAASDPDSMAIVPEGIAPNSSFLWRDQKTMQNLIYEATSFSERAANSRQHPLTESSNYYEMGSSKYDTLCSRRSNAYDTLQHGNHSKSSSSSSSGYDEIRSPDCLHSSRLETISKKTSSVKYDDVKQPTCCATYDELSYLDGRRPSNGYDELRSPPSSSSGSGGYIDPGSSSALGYERILPPVKDQTSDEDGSTLRYEECGSPTVVLSSMNSITVTARPAIVCEDQLDSISYLYDDIRTVNGRMSEPAAYNGSNHSYEPIYAHLGDAGSSMTQMDSSYVSDQHKKSNESVSGNTKSR